MADLGETFDATKITPRSYAIPSGMYKAMIVASEMMENKRRDGSYLLLNHVILEGQYKGMKVDARLNLVSKNPTAVSIAQQMLAEIIRALGLGPTRRSEALHNKPLMIRVEHIPADGEGSAPEGREFRKYANNEIKAWLSINPDGAAKASFYKDGATEQDTAASANMAQQAWQQKPSDDDELPWPKRS